MLTDSRFYKRAVRHLWEAPLQKRAHVGQSVHAGEAVATVWVERSGASWE